MQNVVELCLHLDENCRKHRERKKSREFWGLHFQKLTAYDWWMADTRGKSITGFQLLFTIGIGLILKEIKYWFITLQEAVPFYLGEVCVGGGEGTESGDPLITDSQSSDLVYLDIAISFLSWIRQGRKCSIWT